MQAPAKSWNVVSLKVFISYIMADNNAMYEDTGSCYEAHADCWHFSYDVINIR